MRTHESPLRGRERRRQRQQRDRDRAALQAYLQAHEASWRVQAMTAEGLWWGVRAAAAITMVGLVITWALTALLGG